MEDLGEILGPSLGDLGEVFPKSWGGVDEILVSVWGAFGEMLVIFGISCGDLEELLRSSALGSTRVYAGAPPMGG